VSYAAAPKVCASAGTLPDRSHWLDSSFVNVYNHPCTYNADGSLEMPRRYQRHESARSGSDEFLHVGGTPVAGLTLRQVVAHQGGYVKRIRWSPDGRRFALGVRDDPNVHVLDSANWTEIAAFRGSDLAFAWAPNSLKLASTHGVWHEADNNVQLELPIERDSHCMAWSPNGRFLAVGGARRITVFDAETGYKISELSIDLTSWVEALLWAPDNQFLVSSSQEGKIQIWNVEQGHQLNQIAANSTSNTIAWLPDGRTLVAGQNDGLIKLWDVHLGRSIAELESHSGRVHCVDVSYNGSLLASKSDDNTVRLWDARTFGTLATIREDGAGNELAHRFLSGIAFHPSAPILATLGNRGEAVRLWDYDEALLLGQEADSITYTTAKLVLVGDSGVGKTGLGWRLAHGEFKAQSSTHGQQFWVIPQLGKKRNDGAECEAVLWDLAGQHVYRQVHSIFLEDVAVALVVFDPSNRQDPLKGVEFWLEQLKGRSQLPPAVLVGARTDRGAPTLPQEDLDQFCTKNHIRGGYISTSALSGAGLDALLERVTAQIPWDQMTATITTVTFKRIKDYVLRLKETANHRSTLVTPAELRRKMEAPNLHRRLQSDVVAVGNFSTAGRPFKFTDAEMMTAVGHLQNHGYVTVLEGSSGEEHVLLKPELLVNTAASIMLGLADE